MLSRLVQALEHLVQQPHSMAWLCLARALVRVLQIDLDARLQLVQEVAAKQQEVEDGAYLGVLRGSYLYRLISAVRGGAW